MGSLLPSGRWQIVISYLCPLNINLAFLINVLIHKHCWCNYDIFLKLISCYQCFGIIHNNRSITAQYKEPYYSFDVSPCHLIVMVMVHIIIIVRWQWSVSSNKSVNQSGNIDDFLIRSFKVFPMPHPFSLTSQSLQLKAIIAGHNREVVLQRNL